MYIIKNNQPVYNKDLQAAITTFKECFIKEVKEAYYLLDAIVKNAPGFLGKIKEFIKRKILVGLLANAAENGVESSLQAAQLNYAAPLGNLANVTVRLVAFIYFRNKDKEDEEILKKSKAFIARVEKNGGIDAIINKTCELITQRFAFALEELVSSTHRHEDIQSLAEFFAASFGDVLIEQPGIDNQEFFNFIEKRIVPPVDHDLYHLEIPLTKIKIAFNKSFHYASSGHAWTIEGLLLRSACYTPGGGYLTQGKKEDHSDKYPPQILTAEIARGKSYIEARPILSLKKLSFNFFESENNSQIKLEFPPLEAATVEEIHRQLKHYYENYFGKLAVDKNTNRSEIRAAVRECRFRLEKELLKYADQIPDVEVVLAINNYLKSLIVFTFERFVLNGHVASSTEVYFLYGELAWIKANLSVLITSQCNEPSQTKLIRPTEILQNMGRLFQEIFSQKDEMLNESKVGQTNNSFRDPNNNNTQSASFIKKQTIALTLLTILNDTLCYILTRSIQYSLVDNLEAIDQFKEIKLLYGNELAILLNKLNILRTIAQKWENSYAHWYSDKELSTLLKLYANPYLDKVHLFPDLTLTDAFECPLNWKKELKENLLNYLNHRDPTSPRRILLPIKLSFLQWSLLCIELACDPPSNNQIDAYVHYIIPPEEFVHNSNNVAHSEEIYELLKDKNLLGININFNIYCPKFGLNAKDQKEDKKRLDTNDEFIIHCPEFGAYENDETFYSPFLVECAHQWMQGYLKPEKIKIKEARRKHHALLKDYQITDIAKINEETYKRCFNFLQQLKQLIAEVEDLNNLKTFAKLFYATSNVRQDFQIKLSKFKEELNKYLHSTYFLALEIGDAAAALQLVKDEGLSWQTLDQTRHSALHVAAFHGYPNIFQYLLRMAKKSDIMLNQFTAENGSTLLHSAVFGGNLHLIPLLLDEGIAVNAANASNPHGAGRQTALHIAAKANLTNKSSLIKYLLQKGADINALDEEERLPLHYLLDCQGLDKIPVAIELVKLLISNSNINQQDREGQTPLHIAAKARVDQVLTLVRVLVENGAEAQIQDKYERSPFDILLKEKENIERERKDLSNKLASSPNNQSINSNKDKLKADLQRCEMRLNNVTQAMQLLAGLECKKVILATHMALGENLNRILEDLTSEFESSNSKNKCVIS